MITFWRLLRGKWNTTKWQWFTFSRYNTDYLHISPYIFFLNIWWAGMMMILKIRHMVDLLPPLPTLDLKSHQLRRLQVSYQWQIVDRLRHHQVLYHQWQIVDIRRATPVGHPLSQVLRHPLLPVPRMLEHPWWNHHRHEHRPSHNGIHWGGGKIMVRPSTRNHGWVGLPMHSTLMGLTRMNHLTLHVPSSQSKCTKERE